MRKLILRIFIILGVTVSTFCSAAAEPQERDAAPLPSRITVKTYLKDKESPRAETQITIQPINDPAGSRFSIVHQGKGAFDQYLDVTWSITSVIEQKDGLMRTQSSHTVIRDETGIVMQYEKIYNFETNQVLWKKYKNKDRLLKKADFPLKGMTCDDTNLIFFLKQFLYHRDDPRYQSFYLITNEPRLYKTNIRIIEEDTSPVAGFDGPVIKLKLTGDMGIIDDILDQFVPATYVWYSSQAPYKWLKYQGYETGYKSAYITSQNETTE